MFDGMHNGWMWGMHGFWWIFWLLVIVGLVWTIARSKRGQSESPEEPEVRETPMDILKRRYAEGKLSTEEYEKRKERLEREK